MKYICQVLSVLVILVLTSCSLSGVDNSAGLADVDGSKIDPSHYSGPYASDFANIAKSAKTQAVLDVIDDSNITETELQDIRQTFISCMYSEGYVVAFESGGSESIKPIDENVDLLSQNTTDDMNKKERKCYDATSFFQIQELYNSQNANPEKLDMDVLVAACLVRIGLVPEGYTADDYRYDDGKIDNKFHSIMDSNNSKTNELILAKIGFCQRDPLNYNGL